ncbi:MAG: DUF3450 domain-containing protein [Gammaproteobacteria bacterium]
MPKSAIAGFGALLTGLALAALPLVAQAQEQTLDQSVTTQNQIVSDAASTQAKINGLSEQTQKLLGDYLIAKQQTDQLNRYNANLQGLINNQQASIASLNDQLGHLTEVEHGIVPLMEQMIAGLKNFIQLDVPFHRDARMESANKLEDLMTDANVTISEKYRQIMAAYNDELDSGRTLETYRDQLTVDGKEQTVEFFRVGRITLCYQTLNQSQTGCWNQDTHQWVAKDAFRTGVTNGFSVARKQSPPSLLILPVVPPQAAQIEQQPPPTPMTQSMPAQPSSAPQTH